MTEGEGKKRDRSCMTEGEGKKRDKSCMTEGEGKKRDKSCMAPYARLRRLSRFTGSPVHPQRGPAPAS